MFADAPLWLKLWNRGLDITAAVIAIICAAIIVGIVGIATRKRKQRQQQRLVDELAENERLRVAKQQHDRLTKQRDDYASAMAEADPLEIGEVWNGYWNWLHSNDLDYLPANSRVPIEPPIDHLSEDPDQCVRRLANLIRSTELPPI
ncbi:MAG: hypothetical protein ABSH47_11235 [Bryobacteraceae bacterium]|jgi:oligoendopeptidase F